MDIETNGSFTDGTIPESNNISQENEIRKKYDLKKELLCSSEEEASDKDRGQGDGEILPKKVSLAAFRSWLVRDSASRNAASENGDYG